MRTSLLLLVALMSFAFVPSQSQTTYTIGSIIINDTVTNDVIQALRIASSYLQPVNRYSSFRLKILERIVSRNDTAAIMNAVVSQIGQGAIAIVGPSHGEVMDAVNAISIRTRVPFVSYSAPDVDLAKKSIYPTFVRTWPSDEFLVDGWFTFMKYYKWTRFALIYSDDFYGRGSAYAIINRLNQYSATLVDSVPVAPLSSNRSDTLARFKSLYSQECNVFLMLVQNPLETTVLQLAQQAGILSGRVWFAGTQVVTSRPSAEARPLLEGVYGFRPYYATNTANYNIVLNALKGASVTDPYPQAFFVNDAVTLIAEGIALMASNTIVPRRLNFSSSLPANAINNLGYQESGWNFMTSMLYYVKQVEGVTGTITIDQNTGNRINQQLEVVQFSSNAWVGKNCIYNTGNRNLSVNTEIWPNGAPSDRSSNRTLRVAVGMKSPYAMLQGTAYAGIVVDLFRYVIDNSLPGQSYQFVPFTVPASANGTSYNKLANDVSSGAFDIAIGDIPLSTTTIPSNVESTQPFAGNGYVLLVMRDKDPGTQTWDWIRPFHWSLWLIIPLFLLWSAAAMWLLEKPSQARDIEFEDQDDPFESPYDGDFFPSTKTAYKSLHFSFSTLFSTHNAGAVRTIFGQMFYHIMVLAIFIFIAAYIANWSALLLQQDSRPRINDMDSARSTGARVGFFDAGYYSLGRQVLVNEKLSAKYIIPGLTSTSMYTSALLKGGASGGVDAVVENAFTARQLIGQNCDLSAVGAEMSSPRLVWLLPKGASITSVLNQGLLRAVSSGFFNSLLNRYIPISCPPITATTPASATYISLRFGSFMSLFFIAWACAALVIILHLIFRTALPDVYEARVPVPDRFTIECREALPRVHIRPESSGEGTREKAQNYTTPFNARSHQSAASPAAAGGGGSKVGGNTDDEDNEPAGIRVVGTMPERHSPSQRSVSRLSSQNSVSKLTKQTSQRKLSGGGGRSTLASLGLSRQNTSAPASPLGPNGPIPRSPSMSGMGESRGPNKLMRRNSLSKF